MSVSTHPLFASCLNCLSAECSIESYDQDHHIHQPLPPVSIAFRLNARLKAEVHQRRVHRCRRGVSIAFRLNARLKGAVNSAKAATSAVKVSIAFRLNARLKARRWKSPPRTSPGRLNCLSAECSIESLLQGRHRLGVVAASQLPFG